MCDFFHFHHYLDSILPVSELLSNLTYHYVSLLSCSKVGWSPWNRDVWRSGFVSILPAMGDGGEAMVQTTCFKKLTDVEDVTQWQQAYHCANMFSWWPKIPRIRNNVNMFTTMTLYPIVTVTGQRFRHQRSSLLLLALGYRPNKNRKTPPELELKAGHTVIATSQSLLMTSRSGILDSGNAHPLPATGHGRGVSPKLDSDWFGAMAAGLVQKTRKQNGYVSNREKRWWNNMKDVVNAGKRVGSWSEMDWLISDIVRLHKTCLRPFLMRLIEHFPDNILTSSTWSNLN